jgi:glycosyltransferase-like protein
MRQALRIAILAHSTNPRGGVVHALELGDALFRLGHRPTVFAPDAAGAGFFRDTLCATAAIAVAPAQRNVTAMVETRIADYVRHFEATENRQFDVWHAQDGISANALATLKQARLIHGFARTVHHVDNFADAALRALQLRAIKAADHLFVVSRLWQDWLKRELARDAKRVGNGVDRRRFSPTPDGTDAELAARLKLPCGVPIFLAVGGVEERKNTIGLLRAFASLHAQFPSSRLVIAGGASLLDHHAYQAKFAEALEQMRLPAVAVIQTGPLPQALMPALYRLATALVFPSTKEGFGLVVLEAMASGVPVITSAIPPFTEYLSDDDVLWCDPFDATSIAAAMARSLGLSHRDGLIQRGLRVAARHDWATTARRHIAVYEALGEPLYA